MNDPVTTKEQTPIDRFQDRVERLGMGVAGVPPPTKENALRRDVDELYGMVDRMLEELVTKSDFEAAAAVLRGSLRETGRVVLRLKSRITYDELRMVRPESDRNEMVANVTLAYRHIEDAAMRLGKAIQAFDGGKSVYPR